MRLTPTPPSIEGIGLKTYLDKNFSIAGGYDEFVKRLELSEPKTIIANAFGVNRKTVVKWVKVFEKENHNGKS